MKTAYLDHIGIAVRPGSRLAEAFAILGLPVTGTERVEREKVDAAWIPLPAAPAHVELLQASERSSLIAAFLARAGRDGIHHLSFRVADVRAMSARLQQAGFSLVYPEPKPGAHGCIVNFLHPRSTGGVLLEIAQGS